MKVVAAPDRDGAARETADIVDRFVTQSRSLGWTASHRGRDLTVL